jgi:hypothetical protein
LVHAGLFDDEEDPQLWPPPESFGRVAWENFFDRAAGSFAANAGMCVMQGAEMCHLGRDSGVRLCAGTGYSAEQADWELRGDRHAKSQ